MRHRVVTGFLRWWVGADRHHLGTIAVPLLDGRSGSAPGWAEVEVETEMRTWPNVGSALWSGAPAEGETHAKVAMTARAAESASPGAPDRAGRPGSSRYGKPIGGFT